MGLDDAQALPLPALRTPCASSLSPNSAFLSPLHAFLLCLIANPPPPQQLTGLRRRCNSGYSSPTHPPTYPQSVLVLVLVALCGPVHGLALQYGSRAARTPMSPFGTLPSSAVTSTQTPVVADVLIVTTKENQVEVSFAQLGAQLLAFGTCSLPSLQLAACSQLPGPFRVVNNRSGSQGLTDLPHSFIAKRFAVWDLTPSLPTPRLERR